MPLSESQIEEYRRQYNEAVVRINAMTWEQQKELILANKCPYPVEHLLGVPLGMFHCPLCGTMVIAGVEHGATDEILIESIRTDPGNGS